MSDDLLDQLLAGGDDRAVFEAGAMRGSLKRVLTERALNARLQRQLAGSSTPWWRFAVPSQSRAAAQGAMVQGRQGGN